jgi:hypothetical protein
MIPSEEFLRHAAECRRMAKSIYDPGDRALWVRMAERWNRCAELASCHDPSLQLRKAKGFRQPVHEFGDLARRSSGTRASVRHPRDFRGRLKYRKSCGGESIRVGIKRPTALRK